jgi:hypothetical protein
MAIMTLYTSEVVDDATELDRSGSASPDAVQRQIHLLHAVIHALQAEPVERLTELDIADLLAARVLVQRLERQQRGASHG